MNDFKKLIPHHRADVKMDSKDNLKVINEICEMKSCNKALFFEVRKRTDLYLWVANVPHGPSVKFHVYNVHTMDELKLTGNALVGSRPVLHFDAAFDQHPQWKILKELFSQTFNTPRLHPKSKPFVDHMLCFFIADGKIWFRSYQILWPSRDNTLKEKKLVEIGPRCVLNPVRIFESGFGGGTLFRNPDYQSPNELRRLLKDGQETLAEKKEVREKQMALAKKVLENRPIDTLSGHLLFKKTDTDNIFQVAEENNEEDDDNEDDDNEEEESSEEQSEEQSSSVSE